jgi:hypothetical protein
MKKKILLFLFFVMCFSVYSYTYKTIEDLNADIAKYGKDPVVYTNAGIFYFFACQREKDYNKRKQLVDTAKNYLEQALAMDANNNKARAFLGDVYGMECGVNKDLSKIIFYGNKSMAYLNQAVDIEPFNIDRRANRIRGFIRISPMSPDYNKLTKVIMTDVDFVLNIIEKDMEYRMSNYHYRDTRSEFYYIKGILYKRMNDKTTSEKMFKLSQDIVKQYNLPYNFSKIYDGVK